MKEGRWAISWIKLQEFIADTFAAEVLADLIYPLA
jgi:hypothetical protein